MTTSALAPIAASPLRSSADAIVPAILFQSSRGSSFLYPGPQSKSISAATRSGCARLNASVMKPPSDNPPNDGALSPAYVEDRRHIGHRALVRVEHRIIRRIGAVVPAHIPCDYVIAIRERGHLAGPHPRARAIAVREENRRAA